MARCMIKADSIIINKDTGITYVVNEDTHIEAPRIPVAALALIGRGTDRATLTTYIEMRKSSDAYAVNIDLSRAKLEEY